MVALVRIAVRLVADVATFAILLCRSTTSVQAEIYFFGDSWGYSRSAVFTPAGPTQPPESAWPAWRGCSIGGMHLLFRNYSIWAVMKAG